MTITFKNRPTKRRTAKKSLPSLRSMLGEIDQLAHDLRRRGVLLAMRQEGESSTIFSERANEEEQAALLAEAKTLIETVRKEKRKMKPEESKRFDEIKARVEELKAEAANEGWLQQHAPTQTGQQPGQQAGANVRQAIPTGPNNDGATLEHPYARVRIPATARAPLYLGQNGKPVFTGADARRDSYVAGLFYLAAIFEHSASRERLKSFGLPMVRQSMSEGSNSAGGFLVFDEVTQAIIKLLQEYGQARKFVQVVKMLSDTKTQPKRTGGLTAYFVGENQTGTKSDPAYTNVNLIAKKLMAICCRSSELDENSVTDLGAELTDELGYAFAIVEDRVVFIGDGSSTDGGMTGIVPAVAAQAGSLVTAGSGHVGFDTITLAECRQVVSKWKKKQYQGAQPGWYISPVGKSELFDRLLDAGGGNSNQNLAEGAPPKFLSYPVREITTMDSTIGSNVSKTVALFGDLRQAGVFGDRRSFTVGVSTDRYFEEDQIGIKGTERFAWTNHDVGDATNPGAVVGLKTAAS